MLSYWGGGGGENTERETQAHSLILSFQRAMTATFFLFVSLPPGYATGQSPEACGNSCPFQYVLNREIQRHKATTDLSNTCMVFLSSTLLFLRHTVTRLLDIIPDEDNRSDLVFQLLCSASHVTFMPMTWFANPVEDTGQGRADRTACYDLWVVFLLMRWLS